jgi:hypothetical protein
MLPNSSELSEIIDIANDIKTFDIESFPLEENEFGDFDILTIEKLNKNVTSIQPTIDEINRLLK